MYEGKGVYRHYKGPEYLVIGLGCLESDKDDLGGDFDPNDHGQQYVIYHPQTPGSLLDGTEVDFWMRGRVIAREAFDDRVEVDGEMVERFERFIEFA